ncbi:SDR family oxidoreductase [Schinkia azotoformans]|uniref:3-ketoacyl-(Acyl-carrier-protein) reductase n=1 Tax=Schinkia azotoformans LMG 9581 TaxID=1131731 RepID=K6DIB1_SCHAZ|nr:SDR family oxidoreductase [Schinkia azotoformans]EKN68009.1 3-ketoacyl-(acyl-carrier-protein) reductase [Schinkia azotoformans LMG 9581]MEC1638186.1 SDR family oxidoreductase [Schinkia azotoformans]MEC1721926.1 SDR family oxidoreductase [Schinkia azotoformans]MEC1946380.1 SDR family oxidoreductase [Schinkia azotoformans]MED4351772.1 SDR family oxidoreductase [Schinkia azotoformans]
MEKWALITGASGGIGQAIARTLANEGGYNLYLHYHQNEQGVHELAGSLSVQSKFIRADLSSVEGFYQLTKAITHSVDVLILNAGLSHVGLITDVTDEEVQKMVQLHITSPFLIAKHTIPSMVRKKYGKIIVISSIWGSVGASCEVLYSMVKGGQNTFVKALAKELAPSGINVNGIAPGTIDTNMLTFFSDQDKQAMLDEIPMGRFGRPEEIGHAVSFLISEKSSYINGEILNINGAWFT